MENSQKVTTNGWKEGPFETSTVFGLHLLKRMFELHLGVAVSDEMFNECLKQAPRCHPHSPVGQCGFMGYISPFRGIIEKYGWRTESSFGTRDEGAAWISRFFFPRLKGTSFCHPEEIYSSNRYNNIILHIPHSSTFVPSEKYILKNEDKKLIDFYTDELFPKNDDRITPVVFPYSRLFCDVERIPHDPLEKIGYGISHSGWSVNEYGWLDYDPIDYQDEKKSYLLYNEHHANMSKLLIEKEAIMDKILLLDCHSFSSLPNKLNKKAEETSKTDICIGYNEDESKPDDFVISTIKWHFYNLGYNVKMNTPFSNSKTFPTPVTYHSLMIEVNKRLYMNEETCKKNKNFDCVKRDICSLYDKLLIQNKA